MTFNERVRAALNSALNEVYTNHSIGEIMERSGLDGKICQTTLRKILKGESVGEATQALVLAALKEFDPLAK